MSTTRHDEGMTKARRARRARRAERRRFRKKKRRRRRRRRRRTKRRVQGRRAEEDDDDDDEDDDDDGTTNRRRRSRRIEADDEEDEEDEDDDDDDDEDEDDDDDEDGQRQRRIERRETIGAAYMNRSNRFNRSRREAFLSLAAAFAASPGPALGCLALGGFHMLDDHPDKVSDRLGCWRNAVGVAVKAAASSLSELLELLELLERRLRRWWWETKRTDGLSVDVARPATLCVGRRRRWCGDGFGTIGHCRCCMGRGSRRECCIGNRGVRTPRTDAIARFSTVTGEVGVVCTCAAVATVDTGPKGNASRSGMD